MKMNSTNRKLVAKAMDFASFIIENGEEPRCIMLFGSVARGEADSESDIDVFVESNDREKIDGLKKNFEATKSDIWRQKGADNPISTIAGRLDRHPMKREIESYGIVLYGFNKKISEDAEPYSLFALKFENIQSQKVSIWRKLYGYKQKVGKKVYISKGLVGKIGGRKIEKGVVLIPSGRSKEFVQYLSKNKIVFKVHEVWSE